MTDAKTIADAGSLFSIGQSLEGFGARIIGATSLARSGPIGSARLARAGRSPADRS